MKLEKYKGNPVISPDKNVSWQSLVATNPGAWYDEEKGEVLLLYRAAGDEAEHNVNIALAKSRNGYDFERVSESPIFDKAKGAWDGGSIEDPRVVRFGEWYFITYAAVPTPPGRYWINGGRETVEDLPDEAPSILKENGTRTGLAITKDFRMVYRPGYLTEIHRPMQWVGAEYGTDNPAIWIAFSDDLLEHKELRLLAKAEYGWEEKIGGSAPPIKTDKGWFMLYHAVGPDERYRVGAMMLDLDDPSIVTHRLEEPVLVPEYDGSKTSQLSCNSLNNLSIGLAFALYGFAYTG